VKIVVREFGIVIYPESPLENDMIKKWENCDPRVGVGSKSVWAPHMDWEHNLRIEFVKRKES
jgi:hypothetical protein